MPTLSSVFWWRRDPNIVKSYFLISLWITRGRKNSPILKIKLVVRVAASRLGRVSQLRGNFGSCYKEVDKTSGVLTSSGAHFLFLNVPILHLNAAVDGRLRRSLTPGGTSPGFWDCHSRRQPGIVRCLVLKRDSGTRTQTHTAPIWSEK